MDPQPNKKGSDFTEQQYNHKVGDTKDLLIPIPPNHRNDKKCGMGNRGMITDDTKI